MRRQSLALFLLILMTAHGNVVSAQSEPSRRQTSKNSARVRWTFEQFVARHDANHDGKIKADEFKGNPQFFRVLDRDGDGVITAEEFRQKAPGGNRQQPAVRNRAPEGVKIVRDVEYANVDGEPLRLDLYLPQNPDVKPPLIVWIHGGGWTRGSKSQINPAFIRLAGEGYAAASIDYRLDGLTSHPKQIHDCKGAIRWLRANADKYGYDVTRIGVGGGSAGGHLALLVGLSGGVAELEGDVGGNLGQSSSVDAVVDLFGPSNLGLFADQSERFRHNKTAELLKTASPTTYITDDDPPLLIFHGDKDPVVPLGQSEDLHKRYQEAGLESALHVIEDAGHGGVQFSDPARYELIKEFLDRHIKQAERKVVPSS